MGHPRLILILIVAFILVASGCPEPESQPSDDDVSDDDDDDSAGPVDADGDGYDEEEDCDDSSADVYPGSQEWCNDRDDDCDGAIDEDAVDAVAWYHDDDADGFGGDYALSACADPSGAGSVYSANSADCDDTDEGVNPQADEVCDDGVDNDCDGATDEDCGPPGCDITVPDQALNIAAGLMQTSPGDRVCVRAGTYNEELVLPAHDVELVGLEGAQTTRVVGSYTRPVIRVIHGQGPATLIRGFTIRNGHYETNTAEAGGVHVEGASPTLEDLVIEDNFGTGLALNSSDAVVRGCAIRDNIEAWYGGAIQVWYGSVEISSTTMTGNDASRGGAIQVGAGAEATLVGCDLSDNYGNYGGAVDVDDGVVSMSNVVMDGNESSYGGAMSIDRGSVVIDHAQITDNTGGYTGGLRMDGSTVSLSHVILAGNFGYLGSALTVEATDLTVDHALIHDNDYAPAVAYLYSDSTMVLSNSVVVYNNSHGDHDIRCQSENCPLTLEHTAIWNDTIAPEVTVTGAALPLYPEFIDSAAVTTLDRDYHLLEGNDLIDAADPATSDPDGSTADPGPYGGAGADAWDLDGDGFPLWWQPGPYDAVTYPGLGLDCDDLDPTVYPGAGC